MSATNDLLGMADREIATLRQQVAELEEKLELKQRVIEALEWINISRSLNQD